MEGQDLPRLPIEINVADVLSISDDEVSVVLSEEERGLLKRVLEKVLSVVYAVEVGVEVAPDGTVRIFGRWRT